MGPYHLNPDMVVRRIRGESILVPIANTMEALDSIISLNETAEFIRAKAGQGLNEQAIRDALVEEFDVEPDAAAADIAAVLKELEQIGAIKPGPSP